MLTASASGVSAHVSNPAPCSSLDSRRPRRRSGRRRAAAPRPCSPARCAGSTGRCTSGRGADRRRRRREPSGRSGRGSPGSLSPSSTASLSLRATTSATHGSGSRSAEATTPRWKWKPTVRATTSSSATRIGTPVAPVSAATRSRCLGVTRIERTRCGDSSRRATASSPSAMNSSFRSRRRRAAGSARST